MFSITRTVAAPVAAIVALSFVSAEAQTVSENNRKPKPATMSVKPIAADAAAKRNLKTNGPPLLTFEPVVIYYKVPGKSNGTVGAAPSPRAVTDQELRPKQSAAQTNSGAPKESRPLPPIGRTDAIGLSPVLILYRSFAPVAGPNNSAFPTGKRIPNEVAAGTSVIRTAAPNRSSRPVTTSSKLTLRPDFLGYKGEPSLPTRDPAIKAPPTIAPQTRSAFVPTIIPRPVADPMMMSLTARPLPAMPEIAAAVSGNEKATEVAISADVPASGSAPAGSIDNADNDLSEIAVLSTKVLEMNNTAVHLTLEARYEEAHALLEQAIKAEPNVAKFHRNLSVLFERMKKYDKALETARTAEKLAPTDPGIIQQRCLLELAKNYASNAVGCYEKLNSIEPLDTFLQAYYGIALFRSGNEAESLAVLEKAVASTPPIAEAFNALGVVHYTKKRMTDAIAAFKSAVEADPEVPGLRFNLAVAQFASGNKPAAVSQYRMIKSNDAELATKLYYMLYRDKVVSVSDLATRKR